MQHLVTQNMMRQGRSRRTVALLVDDNKAAATTSFVDKSFKRIPFSAIADAKYDTAQAPTGMTSSAVFDGTGDGISLTTDVANKFFEFGRGDWTVEFNFRYSVVAPQTLIDFQINDGTQMRIRHDGANSLVYDINGGAFVTFDAVSANNWWHIAVGKRKNFLHFFRDGSRTNAIVYENFYHKAGRLNIGGPNNPLTGWMSNVRITKGFCRYTKPYKMVFPYKAES